ncbi:hypothetical protein CRE_13192 [Caenorhabditis remanei]|uniref:Uncharacterized protein n=1 Tax=Caenorhabditis remanei TaxID=31234 RepID=E3NPW3_CAERE|nr:hypothetical protein CRE_13192 [Caenorhabditis remanei]
MSDSNPPAEPNRNRKRKSDSTSDTPSSSSRPPQPEPISSGSSSQSSSSITVENVILTLSTPHEKKDLNANNIAEKVLTFTEEYGEKVAASIGKTWLLVRMEMRHRIGNPDSCEKTWEIAQMMYLRLFNWFKYYEDSQDKEEVLKLHLDLWKTWLEIDYEQLRNENDFHKELEKKWQELEMLNSNPSAESNRNRKQKIDSSSDTSSSSSGPPQLSPISRRSSTQSPSPITVEKVIGKLSEPLEERNLNEDTIAAKVKEFTEKYGLKVATSIGQNWGIVREEMNPRSAVQYKDMETGKQIMYLRLFNWFHYYEDSDEKEEVLNLQLDLEERWLDIEYEQEWYNHLTVYGVWRKLWKPLGIRTIDVEDVTTRVNRLIETYGEPTKRIAASIGKSYATFTHQMAHPSGKRYEEISPGLQELYVRLFNWLEFYKEDWQRVSVLQMHKKLWREWYCLFILFIFSSQNYRSQKEEEKQKERKEWIAKCIRYNFRDAHRYDLGLD